MNILGFGSDSGIGKTILNAVHAANHQFTFVVDDLCVGFMMRALLAVMTMEYIMKEYRL